MPAPVATVSPPAAAQPVVPRALAAVALALLLGLQPLTTDLVLPALPQLARELQAPMGAVQMTMAALILAFGLAQMVWGPIADRVGRRPVLLIGLLLYCAASVGCAFAANIEALIAWRALQGAAMAAAIVCARAIVRDLYEPREGAQVMALALSGLGVIALASPLSGGFIAQAAGWRTSLATVAGVGFATFVFIAWRLPETLARRNPQALQPGPLLRTWLAIARNPVFRAWALLVACTYGGLFTVLAGSSFILVDVLRLSPTAYGALMAIGSFSYITGTLVCRRWIARHGMARTVWRGGFFTLAGGLSAVLPALLGVQNAAWVALAYALFAFGHGMHQPCGQAGVVGPFPRAAGAAAALAGLLLALVAFGAGRWLGVALDGTLQPFSYTLGGWSLLTCVVAWTLVQRHAQ